jgi:integrase/recombinase XerD
MSKHNPANERIKRRYFDHLRHARGLSDASIDPVAQALSRFEVYTKARDFKRFHIEQAKGFKRDLAHKVNGRTQAPLSKATIHAILMALKAFFQWVSREPGYRSKLNFADAEYFNLTVGETRVATTRRDERVPSLEQILHVIRSMPSGTAVERRDRALIAFTLLSGARDRAIASMRMKHVNLDSDTVLQDAREVRTKFSKTFTSTFFPVGDEVRSIVVDWVRYLERETLFGPDDPLFPSTRIEVGAERHFQATGLERKFWSNADPIRRIFRQAFEAAGLPYFNPHSFRKTLVALGERHCRTPEEFKAWSQNLGHEGVLTTFTSYGQVSAERQAEIIRDLGRSQSAPTSDPIAVMRQVVEQLERQDGRRAP